MPSFLPTFSLRRTAGALLCAVAALTGVTVLNAAPASAVCAAPSANFISGTLEGQGHRDINAQVSFDIKDRNGRSIGMDGCPVSGYGKTIWMNMNVGPAGVIHSASTTYRWRIDRLPSNASRAWIEVWTRSNLGKRCPTCDGVVDTSVFGFVNRRAVAINHPYTLVAPRNCGVGGTSGNIQGRLFDAAGRPIKFDSIYAWSELTPDGSLPMQGWGTAAQVKTGYYKIDNLASGQSYVVWARYKGVTQKRFHISVGACKAVPLAFRG